MLYKKCPCCGKKYNSLLFFSRPRFTGCKYLEDYKCHYCTECNNRISVPESNVIYYLVSAILFGVSILFAKYIRSLFHIWEDIETGVANIPFMLLFFFIVEILQFYFLKLTCFKDDEKTDISRDNSDMLLFHNEDIRIDKKEKNILKGVIYFGFLFFAFILLIMLALSIS